MYCSSCAIKGCVPDKPHIISHFFAYGYQVKTSHYDLPQTQATLEDPPKFQKSAALIGQTIWTEISLSEIELPDQPISLVSTVQRIVQFLYPYDDEF